MRLACWLVCLWIPWVHAVLDATDRAREVCAKDANKEVCKKIIGQLELRIEALQQQMLSTRSEYDRLQTHLKNSEESIGKVAQHLEVLHSALNDKQHALESLKNERKAQQTLLSQQRQVLTQQIQAAYMMGRQNYLKLILNQEDPVTLGRMMAYYDYFNHARVHQITEINVTLEHLHTLEQNIGQEENKLKQLVNHEQQKKTGLELTRQEREKILVELASTLESQEKELLRLQEAKRQLEALLGTLGEAMKDIPYPTGENIAFANLQGQLPPPVQGTVLYRFAQPLVGHLRWQGILIGASRGDKVYAIAAGRIVFAQWFRNLGLLLIIDHGEGYMSLYAHNQSLYKEIGTWVKAGEIIASVGNSGGHQQTGLYFEIRQQGIPVDPMVWLRH